MKKLVLSFLLFHSLIALANKEAGNGGDMCEDHFKIVRDDIQSWIAQGGGARLALPLGVSLPDYDTAMLNEISLAHINCTDAKVFIGTEEKTCRNDFVSGVPQITCNADRFNKTKEDDQYVLVHHEYAGLSGFEVNDGDESKYTLSNQITSFYESHVVKHLVIKAPGANTGAECVSEFTIYGEHYSTYLKDRGINGGVSVRSPSVSINPGDTELFHSRKTPGYPYYVYDVVAHADGSVVIDINMAKRRGEGYTSAARGLVTDDSFARGDLWFQANLGLGTGPCKVGTFTVICAATKEIAEANLEHTLGVPSLKKLPKGCGF